jgi:hypothetical protein
LEQFRALLFHEEGRGDSLLACATGTTDPVNEVFCDIGQIIIDDVRDILDVNSP